MVATLPYTGTSNIGFNPFAVSLYTSNLVLFATIKSNASLDVKFPTHECVTTVGFCAYTHRDERNEKETRAFVSHPNPPKKKETKSRIAVASRRQSKNKKASFIKIQTHAP
jgi:hypothetical protein